MKNLDASERVNKLGALSWSVGVGLLMGGFVGWFMADHYGFNPFLAVPGRMLIIGLTVYYSSMTLTAGSGAAAQLIYAPSGDSTPYKTDFSFAASLVARGRYDDAAAAYELQCIENPEDPELYLRLAWLHRDNLQRYDDALSWFQRARAEAKLSAGQRMLVIQEIVDLYVNRLKTPRKAIPELVQMCERFPGTPGAEAAAKQLGQMREMLNRERDGLAPFTAQFLESIGKKSASEAAGEVRRTLEIEGIRSVLTKVGGDRAMAANELGLSPYDLAARMHALGINDG
ncbi:MAG: hypothetical protein EXR93_11750 [Gemmatimonadetes bacterium]|nr:hypothetical protein [Gemmatimonadota bacterium]